MLELKNGCAHPQGRASEEFVGQYLAQKEYEILAKNLRTPFGELDLLLRNPLGQLVLIEIKTLSASDLISTRLTHKQEQRLKNNRQYFASRTGMDVILVVAYVCVRAADQSRRILWNSIS